MAGCNCNSWFFLYSLSLYKFFEEKAFLLEVYDSSKREWANNGSCDVSAIRQLFIETFSPEAIARRLDCSPTAEHLHFRASDPQVQL